MKRMNAVYAIGSLILLSLTACSAFGGTKNEAPKGSVDRKYAKSPDEVSKAASEALGELNINIESDQHDALGGQITAARATPAAEPVIVWYQSADARTTQVSVGVGKGDRGIAELIQEHIAQKLGSPTTRSAASVGARAEGTYDQPVAQCMTAAEQAMKDLKLQPSNKETHDTWAQVEARQADAIPVMVRMNRTEKDKTLVTFSAGNSKSSDTEMLAERLKAEFEKNLSGVK
jgi:hypothetical protein